MSSEEWTDRFAEIKSCGLVCVSLSDPSARLMGKIMSQDYQAVGFYFVNSLEAGENDYALKLYNTFSTRKFTLEEEQSGFFSFFNAHRSLTLGSLCRNALVKEVSIFPYNGNCQDFTGAILELETGHAETRSEEENSYVDFWRYVLQFGSEEMKTGFSLVNQIVSVLQSQSSTRLPNDKLLELTSFDKHVVIKWESDEIPTTHKQYRKGMIDLFAALAELTLTTEASESDLFDQLAVIFKGGAGSNSSVVVNRIQTRHNKLVRLLNETFATSMLNVEALETAVQSVSTILETDETSNLQTIGNWSEKTNHLLLLQQGQGASLLNRISEHLANVFNEGLDLEATTITNDFNKLVSGTIVDEIINEAPVVRHVVVRGTKEDAKATNRISLLSLLKLEDKDLDHFSSQQIRDILTYLGSLNDPKWNDSINILSQHLRKS